jgi:cytochrome c-type biogenesis protein CcmH
MRHRARARRSALACAVALLAVAAGPATPASATAPDASLTDIEDQVMCVSCHTPLAVSESPQGNAEREFIRSMIARGDSRHRILDELVAQYGPGVLALPRAHGFNLVVYILPPAVVLAALAALVYSLPRWRRRASAAEAAGAVSGSAGAVSGAAPGLDPADALRLDDELARFDR